MESWSTLEKTLGMAKSLHYEGLITVILTYQSSY